MPSLKTLSMHLTKSKRDFANNSFRWDEESLATKVSAEMVQTPLAIAQPTAPPSSPNLSPSKCFVTLSDAQELEKAVTDMQMASTHTLKCTCFHMPPEYLSEADSTDLCSSTPCLAFPANQPLAQLVTTEHVQQVLDILKSLSPKQEPHPPPAAENRVEPEKPKARASTLEFKEVNEVYVYVEPAVQPC